MTFPPHFSATTTTATATATRAPTTTTAPATAPAPHSPMYARYAFDYQGQNKPLPSQYAPSGSRSASGGAHVKLEDSPDLPPLHSASLPPSSRHAHAHTLAPFHAPEHGAGHRPSSLPLFRFGAPDIGSPVSPGSNTSFNFMATPWSTSASPANANTSFHHQQPHHGSHTAAHSQSHMHGNQQYLDRHTPSASAYTLSSLNGHHSATAQMEDYEDEDDLGELPLGLPSYGLAGSSSTGSGVTIGKDGKQIRRRSSKACDQCRKSKCKCERGSPHEPCRNCVMLGTACTFLGPSRKRGPPKGYIDAIEARLHQTEALIGILLGSKDGRARSVLEDIAEDPLAKEIINRVDNSPYGHKGRARGAEATGSSRSRPTPSAPEDGHGSIGSTHPSNEWQDQVIARLNAAAASRNTLINATSTAPGVEPSTSNPSSIDFATADLRYPDDAVPEARARPNTSISIDLTVENDRRQRRRVDGPGRSPSTASVSGRSRSPGLPARLPYTSSSLHLAKRGSISSLVEDMRGRASDDERASDDVGEDELAIEVGQLSLNEDEQLRFHGKVSGLHLLGHKERLDGRYEGGIWRFPKARVWPPLPPTARVQAKSLDDFAPRLPDQATQETLLELYFTYVHPVLPIVHKKAFMEDFRNGNTMSADSPYSDQASDAPSPISSSASTKVRRRTPTILLLAMFSIAARYSASSADVPPPEPGCVWTAGDSYLEDAKVILDASYAASRPSTCQALLLLAYREVGIGAMAQAWLYVGMAVRMAQDLGLHKCADQWTSVGRSLFSATQLQERRRIWYGCIVMDKYVSAYIGRPVAVFERDFDTELPSTAEADELELWTPHRSPALDDGNEDPRLPEITPTPGYVISCFGESAKLAIILSMIMQDLYAIRPKCERQSEFSRFEKVLTKWYLELPEHLRFDPAHPKGSSPLPHVLTLHMQYWCTVLLLRRPFIRHLPDPRPASSGSKDSEIRANSRKNYDLCVQAANHITSIVSIYVERFNPKRASAFMCYYVFTAAIMHVAALRTYPSDAQARVNLEKCMNVLEQMQVVWPGAYRALELLHGTKPTSDEPEVSRSRHSDRQKRPAEHPVDREEEGTRLLTSDQLYRQSAHYHNVPPQSSSPAPGQSGFINLNLPPGESYMSSYDRWAGESSLPSFGSTLTTSVLPQQYSTGLVDERLPSGIARSAERHGQRYPQYWSDYSSLGQIDTSYGVPVMNDIHGSASQSDQSSMYVQEPYGMFGNMHNSQQ